MGFFSDLKEDLSQAVTELMPESEIKEEMPEAEVTAEETPEDVNPDDIADLLANLTGTTVVKDDEEVFSDISDDELLSKVTDILDSVEKKEEAEEISEEPEESAEIFDEAAEEEPETMQEAAAPVCEKEETCDVTSQAEDKTEEKVERTHKSMGTFGENEVASEEKSIITEGMMINGDIMSKGSLEILGEINGNVEILGKLDILGVLNGDSQASEIYAENAKIVGQISSKGSVKVGQNSVIIGNVFATSAVIAGAIKGDIDVKGPVILDTSAIVMGNIKSKSVQINNGAVVEGLCSQCYADVNPSAFFDEFKKSTRA